MEQLAHNFKNTFNGYQLAYGTFQILGADNSEKRKGKALTARGEVTHDLWTNHLRGNSGLGIVPLRSDNTLYFGAIDVDDYTITLQDLNNSINEANLPLIPFRSKSGGAHLYVFLEEPVEARKVRLALSKMAELLGFPTAEIFPKQDLRPDPTSIGNWLNMPYYNAENTDRYGLDEDGNAIPVDQIIDYINDKRINDKVISHYCTKKKTNTKKKEPLPGGPPCLNTLSVRGFPDDCRNNTLFNLGVYAKKSEPDSWESLIEKYNRDLIEPPLDHKEVGAIVKSLMVKDYNYKCKDKPIVSVCNKSKCLVCKYGVRPDEEIPKLGKLRKILTDPPIWQIEVIGGGKLELSTEELQTPRLFQKRCMESLNVMPPAVKADQWREIISGLLENLEVVEVPKETSPKGRLVEHLYDFLEGRVQAKKREEILSGRPYLLDEMHYFRMRDFQSYLEKVKFSDIKQNKIISTIKDISGIQHVFWNIRGSGVNLWTLKSKKEKESDEQDTRRDASISTKSEGKLSQSELV